MHRLFISDPSTLGKITVLGLEFLPLSDGEGSSVVVVPDSVPDGSQSGWLSLPPLAAQADANGGRVLRRWGLGAVNCKY